MCAMLNGPIVLLLYSNVELTVIVFLVVFFFQVITVKRCISICNNVQLIKLLSGLFTPAFEVKIELQEL